MRLAGADEIRARYWSRLKEPTLNVCDNSSTIRAASAGLIFKRGSPESVAYVSASACAEVTASRSLTKTSASANLGLRLKQDSTKTELSRKSFICVSSARVSSG